MLSKGYVARFRDALNSVPCFGDVNDNGLPFRVISVLGPEPLTQIGAANDVFGQFRR